MGFRGCLVGVLWGPNSDSSGRFMWDEHARLEEISWDGVLSEGRAKNGILSKEMSRKNSETAELGKVISLEEIL